MMTTDLVAWDCSRCLLLISKEDNGFCAFVFVVGGGRASSASFMGCQMLLWPIPPHNDHFDGALDCVFFQNPSVLRQLETQCKKCS